MKTEAHGDFKSIEFKKSRKICSEEVKFISRRKNSGPKIAAFFYFNFYFSDTQGIIKFAVLNQTNRKEE